jgi:Conserved hypothetical protein (DUF2461)
MADFAGFRPAAFRFLRDLARNNQKVWFEANRGAYEREVRDPMRLLVETLDAKLGSIAPEIVGDPKRSMFRIHRDVRFSRDKSPYKTNAGAWLRAWSITCAGTSSCSCPWCAGSIVRSATSRRRRGGDGRCPARQAGRAPGPRSKAPGRLPVGAPFSSVT